MALAAAGQRTGAIYLWGYTAEMSLKAAYFAFTGLAEDDALTWGRHLQPAIARGQGMGIAWPHAGAGHNVRAWAELLVATRALHPPSAYSGPFGRALLRRCLLLGRLWRETLRYKGNLAYDYEVEQVREAAAWLLANQAQL